MIVAASSLRIIIETQTFINTTFLHFTILQLNYNYRYLNICCVYTRMVMNFLRLQPFRLPNVTINEMTISNAQFGDITAGVLAISLDIATVDVRVLL